MKFEFDPKKNEQNHKKHGIDFEKTQKLWDVTHVIILAKNVSGENRQVILGTLDGKIHAAVFTVRDEATRIISCHRADKKLEKIYEKLTKKKED